MNSQLIDDIIAKNVKVLTAESTCEYQYVPSIRQELPNIQEIKKIVELIKNIIFPGFFGDSGHSSLTLQYHLGICMEYLYCALHKQIDNGIKFFNDLVSPDFNKSAEELAAIFLEEIPEIKRLLCTDVKAIFEGDPAARSYREVIFCYPAIQAMIHYRTAHALLKLGVPVIPRIITELAHSLTGIDIHPGAQIGEYFGIDHGTGVVIGETCIIGNHVRLYQGVTLGAKSFTFDEKGNPINNLRHPILEDNVIVYSNAAILGRITIGHDSVIGGNVWLTHDVPPHSTIIQQRDTTKR